MKTLRAVAMRMRQIAAALFRESRRLRDSLLHPTRHRAAKDGLRSAARPRTILVVCHGNVCRSPYLEAVLKRDLPDILVSSAGFIGPGRQVPESGMTIASLRGLDLTAHRSRLITRQLLQSTDLVLVMDARQRRHVMAMGVPGARVIVAGDLDPVAGGSRAIRDPWGASQDVFESSYARLDRCAATLTTVLPPATPRS